MSKRQSEETTRAQRNIRPRFPEAGDLAGIFKQEDLVVRDNTDYLANMSKATLFTRPTQLGKSTLLSLAEKVYSKREIAPPNVAPSVPSDKRNSGYVIRFDFLEVAHAWHDVLTWAQNLEAIDGAFLQYIKTTVEFFLEDNSELKKYFRPVGSNAGSQLSALSQAVARYAKNNKTDEFFMVLVDEYDRPVREALFKKLELETVETLPGQCPNYISFFSSCKVVNQKQEENNVWVTGVVPIVLDLISDFKPTNMTFDTGMSDALGLLDADVNRMLRKVQAAEKFDDAKYDLIREAIRDHANHLQFLGGSPLYHTRMVNEFMKVMMDENRRNHWLQDPSKLPASVTREYAPRAVFNLLKKNNSCREIAKNLAAKKDVHGILNEKLNLPSVANAGIDRNDYLTLLVHLGIVSVHCIHGAAGHIFRSTSRFFRSMYLNELLGLSLAPLFDFRSVDEIYENKHLIQEFLEMLPASGMSKMIRWANSSSTNRILELQFQGFLVGELHEHFLSDEAGITQEDVIDSGRTDVRLKGKSTLLVLELKQKPGNTAPTLKEMGKHHEQLCGYVDELSKKHQNHIVAGFVVVMYACGTKFRVERTTYE